MQILIATVELLKQNPITGSFYNSNIFGGFIALIFPIFGFAQQNFIKIPNYLKIIIISSGCLILLITQSLWAIFSLLFTVIFFSYQFKIKKFLFLLFPKVVPSTTLVLGGVFLIFFILVLSFINQESLINRVLWIIVGLKIFLDYPIFGCGLDNYQHLFLKYKFFSGENTIHPHSYFIQSLSEGGILNGIILLLLVYFVFKYKNNSVIMLSILCGLINNIFESNLYFPGYSIFFWILFGIFNSHLPSIKTINLNFKTYFFITALLLAGISITLKLGNLWRLTADGKNLIDTKQFLKADSIFKKIIKTDKLNFIAFEKLSDINLQLYNDSKNPIYLHNSINYLNSALLLNPYKQEYLMRISKIYLYLGDKKTSKKILKYVSFLQ